MDHGGSEIAAPCFSAAPLSNPDKGNHFWQRVYDALPPDAERMVGVVSKNPTSKVAEPPPDEWPSELNRATRRSFIDFSRLESKHPDVMEIVNMPHTAAMRAAASEKG